MTFIESVFLIVLLFFAVPVAILVIQILLSLLPYRPTPFAAIKRPTIAVLIPAHNESAALIPTLVSVKAQLEKGDQVIVIADNCSDDTASVARKYGAEVLERVNEEKRGKGYALDFGVRYIEQQAHYPDVVIVVDADCLLGDQVLERLAKAAISNGRPIQALYLMASPEGAGLKTKIAEFAWAVKNWTRPLGFKQIGLPCQLMGTGMAFPWELIRNAELASGHIVEDLKLGLDFARMGLAPLFLQEVRVNSVFPLNNEGVKSQRTRWEHGHLGMIVKEGPKFIWQGIRFKNLDMLALALDMCVPPLALLTLSLVALSVFAGVGFWISGELLPWIYAVMLLGLLGVSILLAWLKFGRNILTFANLAYAPVYALVKIPVYLKFIVKRQVEWVRSKRD